MITITIEQTTTAVQSVKENVVTEKTPTAERDGYSDIVYACKYEVKEVDKTEIKTVKLLEQRIDDEKFNLGSVIKALNNL